jgi:hypothetical protein
MHFKTILEDFFGDLDLVSGFGHLKSFQDSQLILDPSLQDYKPNSPYKSLRRKEPRFTSEENKLTLKLSKH